MRLLPAASFLAVSARINSAGRTAFCFGFIEKSDRAARLRSAAQPCIFHLGTSKLNDAAVRAWAASGIAPQHFASRASRLCACLLDPTPFGSWRALGIAKWQSSLALEVYLVRADRARDCAERALDALVAIPRDGRQVACGAARSKRATLGREGRTRARRTSFCKPALRSSWAGSLGGRGGASGAAGGCVRANGRQHAKEVEDVLQPASDKATKHETAHRVGLGASAPWAKAKAVCCASLSRYRGAAGQGCRRVVLCSA